MPPRNPDAHENVLAAAWEGLKRQDGLAAVEQWEKQHGRLTAAEISEARRTVQKQFGASRPVRRPA
jgi:hypothetical protein